MRDVVIWGCPRSGTSITFEIFKHHTEYRHFFEPGMWVFGHPPMDSVTPYALKNPVSERPTRGLSADVDEVTSMFPGALHVWVTRDPLDTVASLRPGMEEQPHPPRLDDHWQHKPLIDRCAALWRLWNVEGKAELSLRARPYEMSYEDLIADPRGQVEMVLREADAHDGYDYESFTRRITNTPGEHEAAFQVRWHRPHETHVGRGLVELTALEREVVLNIIA